MAHTGMRKGISLVEMVIAIILFAVLAVISLKYTNFFINTDMQAKKARVAALTEQAHQLVMAYQIYKAETGVDPLVMQDLNKTSGILTNVPTNIAEMSTIGWELNSTTNWGGDHNVSFQFNVNLNGTNTGRLDNEQYCALFNREFNTSRGVNVTDGLIVGTTGNVAASRTVFGKYFCFSKSASNNSVIVVIP